MNDIFYLFGVVLIVRSSHSLLKKRELIDFKTKVFEDTKKAMEEASNPNYFSKKKLHDVMILLSFVWSVCGAFKADESISFSILSIMFLFPAIIILSIKNNENIIKAFRLMALVETLIIATILIQHFKLI